MRVQTTRRLAAVLIALAGCAAIAAAPVAVADPDPTLPQCEDVAGSEQAGTATTECATPGNVQLNATPPVDMQPDYPYPYDDDFYGPALVFGNDNGYHGGGGGGRR